VVSTAGELSAGMLAALLARAELVVSNDSGPMHLAAALGAPTVGLFGPETPVMYAPLGVQAVTLYRPPPCSPCINVHDNKVASCIWGEPQCLVNVPVQEVLDAARAVRRGEAFELTPSPVPAEGAHDQAAPEQAGSEDVEPV
jgi:ADP-heptose:LPS heptosyltransferase